MSPAVCLSAHELHRLKVHKWSTVTCKLSNRCMNQFVSKKDLGNRISGLQSQCTGVTKVERVGHSSWMTNSMGGQMTRQRSDFLFNMSIVSRVTLFRFFQTPDRWCFCTDFGFKCPTEDAFVQILFQELFEEDFLFLPIISEQFEAFKSLKMHLTSHSNAEAH